METKIETRRIIEAKQSLNPIRDKKVFIEKICKLEINTLEVITKDKLKNTNRIPQNSRTTYKIKGIKDNHKIICEITSLDGTILGRGDSVLSEYKQDFYKGWLLAQHRANINWREKSIDIIRRY